MSRFFSLPFDECLFLVVALGKGKRYRVEKGGIDVEDMLVCDAEKNERNGREQKEKTANALSLAEKQEDRFRAVIAVQQKPDSTRRAKHL